MKKEVKFCFLVLISILIFLTTLCLSFADCTSSGTKRYCPITELCQTGDCTSMPPANLWLPGCSCDPTYVNICAGPYYCNPATSKCEQCPSGYVGTEYNTCIIPNTFDRSVPCPPGSGPIQCNGVLRDCLWGDVSNLNCTVTQTARADGSGCDPVLSDCTPSPNCPHVQTCAANTRTLEYSQCACKGNRADVYYDACLNKWEFVNMRSDMKCNACFYTTNCPAVCTDNDGDGYGQNCLRGPDCYDNDPTKNTCDLQAQNAPPTPPPGSTGKFTILFVPIAYSDAGGFRAVADGIFNRFIEITPFSACPSQITADYLEPADCTGDCDTACPLFAGYSGSVSCIDVAKECATAKGKQYSRIMAIVNKQIYYGACTEGYTDYTSVNAGSSTGINSNNGADLRDTHFGLHELGHSFGLCEADYPGIGGCKIERNLLPGQTCPNDNEGPGCIMDNCEVAGETYCTKGTAQIQNVLTAGGWLANCAG